MCDQSTANALNYKLQNTKYKQIPNYNVQNYKSINTGTIGPHAPGSRPPFLLLSPNGDEVLQAAEKFLIKWDSGKEVDKVKLEYSPDNGSTYLGIANGIDNTGYYEWLVPHHISSGCLVRVSEVKERKVTPGGFLYEVDFRVNGVDFSSGGDIFSIYLGDVANDTINNSLPGVSFIQESNGKSYIKLYENITEIGRSTEFSGGWHNIRVMMDNVYDQISVILDGKLVLEDIPRVGMAYFSPAISFSVGPGNTTEVEFDDIYVKAFYSWEDKNQWMLLFNDDFDRFSNGNGLEKYGWRTKCEQATANPQKEAGKGVFVNLDQLSEQKTLTIQPEDGKQVTVVKSFNIPIDFPFDTSDKPFEIRYNDDMNSDVAGYDQIGGFPGHGGEGALSNDSKSKNTVTPTSTTNISRTQADSLIDTYYIYTYDGKLLAEYDHSGNCVKDYIYMGNRLIAEYKPQTGEYFYYMTDQINSTRIITDGSGNVVFSEASGPYGDVQKTWTNTYDPKLKFSGKEREGYSDLDYFGARYYDHKSFRFNSVDPIINRDEPLVNPQLWNLYAYCRNNPITFFDPDGRDWMIFTGKYINYYGGDYGDTSNLLVRSPANSGQGEYQSDKNSTGIKDKGPIPEGKWYINLKDGGITKSDKNGNIIPGDGLQQVDYQNQPAWGEHRARLWPAKGTDDKGRTTLYLHDSETGCSKGCVSTWGDKEIFNKMNTLRIIGKQKQIYMKVEYKDR